jgi:hypothetical protein
MKTESTEFPYWTETHKGDSRCRVLADRHYSRQNPGHPMFTRPGYNQVLYCADSVGTAVWVWFRPKWESGIKGTLRKDGLFAIECTLFRNETGILSSELIIAACLFLLTWERAQDVEWPDGAITGVNSKHTARRRSKHALPGKCYREAGWEPFEHRSTERADVWLHYARTSFDALLEVFC